MKVLHTEGEWRIVKNNDTMTKIYLEHHCQKNGTYKGTWVPMRFQYYQFASPCGWCQDTVPEGLQGLWVMLTDSDMVTYGGVNMPLP